MLRLIVLSSIEALESFYEDMGQVTGPSLMLTAHLHCREGGSV